MKRKLKSIIGNGSPYGILFFGLSFIMGYYIADLGIRKTLVIAAGISVPAVIINGLLYSRFTKPLKQLEQITIALNNGETLLIQAPANFIVNDGLLPGKLFLTNDSVIFKSLAVEGEAAALYFWNRARLKMYKCYTTFRNAGGQFQLSVEDEDIF